MRFGSFAAIAGLAAVLTFSIADAAEISGAGATFPDPIYAKWSEAYEKETGTGLAYQSIGSAGGIKQIVAKAVTFGASDKPLPQNELDAYGLVQFPLIMGGIVPVINVEGIKPGDVVLDGPTLARIFMGEITQWDDPAIKALNEKIALPALEITVVHRSDGSGTTYIWVDYLSKVSPEFKKTVGVATSVKWPVGVGGKGNEGVAGLVSQTPGSVGYVELIYALQNKIAYGSVQNSSGNFVRASIDAVTAAADAAASAMPADFRVSITNPPGKDAYPIASFTWLLLYENAQDKAQAKVMVDFLKWALADGQKQARDLGYAPLPSNIVALVLKAVEKIKL
jgi:phosphate transport system substrate-binding protein